MSPAISNSLIELLLASGVPSRDEAAELSSNLNGGSWTAQVLDSGKVDEQRFLDALNAPKSLDETNLASMRAVLQMIFTAFA